MAGFAPNMAQNISIAKVTTAAGSSYGTAYFTPGRSVVQVDFVNGTTGRVSFTALGSVSTSDIWYTLLTAPSTLTSGQTAHCVSTGAVLFDRVRIATSDAQESATTVGLPHAF